MPLEIKELIIKVNVVEPGGEGGDSGQSGNQNGQPGGQNVNKKAIVQECVEQVMEILKKKTER